MSEPQRSRISQRVASLSPSGIRKFFDLIIGMDDVISLGVGEPDFATPWHIREAAIHSLNRGNTHYSSNYGLLELREAINASLGRRYGITYDPKKQILVTVGVSEGLDLAMRATLDPGDEIIIPEPSYVSYQPCAILAGAVPVTVPTTAERGFQITAADIEPRLTPRTKAVLLGYPNNPTGTILDMDSMLSIAELVRKHDLLVISDEVYDRIVYEHEHVCWSSIPGMKERTILLGGMSKDYAMTGWRVGYAASSAEIIEAMMKVHQYTIMCAPTMSQVAAIEALATGDAEVDKMVAEYDRRRRLIVHGLNAIGLPCVNPKGAFYAFPSIKSTGLTSEEFAEMLLKEERVAVVPGSAFGPSGEGHVRCCYAVSTKEIEEALRRIKRFVRGQSGFREPSATQVEVRRRT